MASLDLALVSCSDTLGRTPQRRLDAPTHGLADRCLPDTEAREPTQDDGYQGCDLPFGSRNRARLAICPEPRPKSGQRSEAEYAK
jgi:hypothetical protein